MWYKNLNNTGQNILSTFTIKSYAGASESVIERVFIKMNGIAWLGNFPPLNYLLFISFIIHFTKITSKGIPEPPQSPDD